MCALNVPNSSLGDLLSLAVRNYVAMQKELDRREIIPLPGVSGLAGADGTHGGLSLSLLQNTARLTEQGISLWASAGVLPDTDVLELWSQNMGGSQADTISTVFSLQHMISLAVLISNGELDLAYHALNGSTTGEEVPSTSRSTLQKMPTGKDSGPSVTQPDLPLGPPPEPVAALRDTKPTKTGKRKKKSGKKSKKTKKKVKRR